MKPLDYLNTHAQCPDCDSKLFIEGPSGGASVNIKCAQCGSKFWYCPPFTPQRIDNSDEFYTRPPVNLWVETFGMVVPPQSFWQRVKERWFK